MSHLSGPSKPIPVPSRPLNVQNKRLWVGNLDTRLTEYSLLKIFQKFGELEKFDFLVHKTGPDAGTPRGYCFVSYKTRHDAERAMKGLNGKQALTKRLFVRWANAEPQEQTSSKQVVKNTQMECSNLSTENKIKAIEDKLLKMDNSKPDFTSESQLKAPPGSSSLSAQNIVSSQQKMLSRKPYSKPRERRGR